MFSFMASQAIALSQAQQEANTAPATSNSARRKAPAKASGRASSTQWSTRACGERKSSFATIAACTKKVPANEHLRDIAGARSTVARHALSAPTLSGRQKQSRPVGGARSAWTLRRPVQQPRRGIALRVSRKGRGPRRRRAGARRSRALRSAEQSLSFACPRRQ